jgi:phosphatidylinositol-3-phosphatase
MCDECASPLDRQQRYCLLCGARTGAPSPLLARLQRRVSAASAARGETSVESQTVEGGPASDEPAGAPSVRRGLHLPPPKVSALLVLLFLGFGVLLGAVEHSSVRDSLAASTRPRLKLMLPAAAPAAAAASSNATADTSEASGSQETEGGAPESEAEPTPAPTKATPPKTATTKATPPSTEGGSTSSPSSSGEGGEAGGSAAAPAKKLPPIKHVFVIMLSDEPYASVFGPVSPAHYLAGTLEHEGTLLVRYDAVAHEELANEIALISGQGPTAETAANCPNYTDIAPTGIAPDAQILGSGCVYPATTQTLGDQLAAKHLTWRAYVEGSDEGGTSAPGCGHPVVGQADPSATQTASSGPYVTFRNPFLYFQSVTSSAAECASEDPGLGSLKGDLATVTRTPNFSYIVPDRCHDGNPTPCTPGAPAGLVPADGFIKQVVPEIMASKAYKQGGLIAITVDEAPSSGEFADSSSCCGQPLFPNLPAATSSTGLSPRGGGTVGALLLSPYLKGAVTSQEPYNHFSLLRTIEDLFGLGHLGYAALPSVKSFEVAMFSSKKLG